MKKAKWGIVIAVCLFFALMLPLQGFSKGGSSFSSGGGGRSFSSSSSSRSSNTGFSSSTPKSSSGGFSSSSPSKSSAPSTTTSSGFSNSGGSSATPSTANKSASSFSTGVNAGIATKAAETPPNSPTGMKATSAPSGYKSPNSSVTVQRIYVAPSYWTPTYYHSYGYSPAADMVDFWYKMEMLKTMHDINERQRIMMEMRSDPKYAQWKAEAKTQAEKNPELKKDLDGVDNEMVSVEKSIAYQSVAKPNKRSMFWSWVLIFVAILVIYGIIHGVVRYRNRTQ
jgi:hypothetical protein